LHPLLKEARAGGGWRGRQALVAMQVALCTMLLVGAGLTILTLQRLQSINAGFESSHIVTFSVDTDMAKYKPEQAAELQRRLLEGARELPDVESAAISSRGLMRGTGLKMTVARSGESAGPEEFMNTSIHAVSPEYFATMRVAWLAGRNFTGREDPTATPKPVIVNETFMRRFGAGREVLGAKFGSVLMNGKPAKPSFEVIGIVRNTKYRSLREPFQPIIYKLPILGDSFIVHLRTRSSPESVIAPMRKMLAGLDPRLSDIEVTTLASEVAASLWAERVAAFLATVFSAAAAVIVAAGLYALVAFAVMQRRREIGIRMALGALPRNVVRLMFARAAWLAATGVTLGLVCSWAVAPQISSILYEVKPRDLTVLVISAALAFSITATAALIPSLRAARIHPASLLRQE
jgi:putative ABC transport system permease protein